MAKLYPPGSFSAEPDDLKRFTEVYVEPSNACFFIAIDQQGEVVGTAAARPYDRRSPFINELLGTHAVCEVTKVYIDDRLRRQGGGSALNDEVETYMRQANYEIAYLHTSSYLPGGLPFWQSKGYLPRYAEPGSVIHMTKDLCRNLAQGRNSDRLGTHADQMAIN